MHLAQKLPLKQIWLNHGLPSTDHHTFEFWSCSRGEAISIALHRSPCSLWSPIAALGFPRPLAVLVCSASKSLLRERDEPQMQFEATNSRFSYLRQKLFLSAFVCALCATPILDLAQVCELQSPGVLDSNQHACKLLPLLGCSLLLTSSLSLSLSKASHTWWWVNKVSPSPSSLFQSLIMERALCFFSGLGFAWGAWNWAYRCQSNHLHFCHSGSQCGYLSAWTQEGESREHKMILWR